MCAVRGALPATLSRTHCILIVLLVTTVLIRTPPASNARHRQVEAVQRQLQGLTRLSVQARRVWGRTIEGLVQSK